MAILLVEDISGKCLVFYWNDVSVEIFVVKDRNSHYESVSRAILEIFTVGSIPMQV